MIYYDVTKMAGARQKSGLTRVSSRLQEELGTAITLASWDSRKRNFHAAGENTPIQFTAQDWMLTVELFNPTERPGFRAWMNQRPCRTAAMFYDAIPLRFPHVTWPQSVQRHPEHMKMLADFDLVFAISQTSKADLLGFWQWQGVAPRARVTTIEFGADFDGSTRITRNRADQPSTRPQLLCVGIVEPRKNQGFLLEVCEALWREGLDFDLHIVGRLNPHFGAPLGQKFQQTRKREPRFHFHEVASDSILKKLYSEAQAVVFPTQAEGYGLPLLEALWYSVPCVCSDLPVLRENADDGGCLTAKVNDQADWQKKLKLILTNAPERQRLQAEALKRTLPRWQDTAQTLLHQLR